MSTAKKLWISIVALSVATLMAVVAIIVVFASTSQSVGNNFSVLYTARDVDCHIRFYYVHYLIVRNEDVELGALDINATDKPQTFAVNYDEDIDVLSPTYFTINWAIKKPLK